MKLKFLVHFVACCGFLLSTDLYAQSSNMVSLSEEELAGVQGQALMNLSYLAPGDSTNLMPSGTNIGFYKLGLEAEMELNANIKNLQLGCGGVNGAGGCDVDIKNLSLSALPDTYDTNGNPVYANGRASTSAKLTNPFMEFAIKNPNTASTREVIGFRASAEKISGLLTAGLLNAATPSATDGIQSLSGFMRIAATTGDVNTKSAIFGNKADQ